MYPSFGFVLITILVSSKYTVILLCFALSALLQVDGLTVGFVLQRGKFYPQLNYLVKVNTPRAVMAETKKAFRKLPNLEQAITALSNLKGVGTTMASGN